jgi:hypothetical protein
LSKEEAVCLQIRDHYINVLAFADPMGVCERKRPDAEAVLSPDDV